MQTELLFVSVVLGLVAAEVAVPLVNLPPFLGYCEPAFAYFPCSCRVKESVGLSVSCGPLIPRAALITAAFVRGNLKSNISDFHQVEFRLRAFNDIPTTVLGVSTAENIAVVCPDSTFPLTIAATAFSASRGSLKSVTIEKCDLSQLDWNFLPSGPGTVLETLRLTGSSVATFASIPRLPNLQSMYLIDITDLAHWYPPAQTPQLARLQIDGSRSVPPEVFDDILAGVATTNQGTLEVLSLADNGLTRIPSGLNDFTNLVSLILTDNAIRTLPAGALRLSARLTYLWLGGNGMSSIEPGAFVGDLSDTVIELANNALSDFPQEVFEDLLVALGNGDIRVTNNPFQCECDLSWLIVNNTQLISKVKGGVCANLESNPSFDELDSDTICLEPTTQPATTTAGAESTVSGPGAKFAIISMGFVVAAVSSWKTY